MHIGFSTMDAKVNDTKILIKKLVLDPNMNRGVAVGVGNSCSSSSNSSSSSSSSAPPPPQPKLGRSSKPVPKRSTQSRLAFSQVVDPTDVPVYFTRSDVITVPFICLFSWPVEYREQGAYILVPSRVWAELLKYPSLFAGKFNLLTHFLIL